MDWLVFIVLVMIAASSGAVFKPGAWYDSLHKPWWNPPSFVFPIVWTLLYALIAWAGVLAWRAGDTGLLALWGAQWLFNSAWSWLFFGRQRMDLGFVDVCLLWLSVLAFIALAWASVPTAAYLFMPYLLWVSIAACLNRSVWRRNQPVIS